MGCIGDSIRKDGLPMKALYRRAVIGRCSDMALRCFYTKMNEDNI